jgi:RimJ/RimL family protein N-acetyltransferase
MTLKCKPTASSDLDFALTLEVDPDAAPWITTWTRSRHEQALLNPDEASWLLEEHASPVGFLLLAGLSSQSHSIELRRIVVGPKGEAIGRRALDLVLRFAFDDLNAHRVWLDVNIRNERARRAYAAAGFIQEGILRDALWADGRYESIAIMSILEHERRREI